MMIKLIKITIFLIILPKFIFAANESVKTTGVISEDVRLELRTQELILERIIKHYDKNGVINHHNVASYYIEGIGPLFEVQRFPTSDINLFEQFGTINNDNRSKYVWSDKKNAIVKFETKYSKKDSIEVIQIVNDFVKDLHLAIFEFFADYMSQENWLKENEKVYVHFDLNLNRKIPKEYDRKMVENIIPLSLQASVAKKDLHDFKIGKLNLNEFDKKIKLKKGFMNPNGYNYNILGDVIQSSIRSFKEGNERPFSLYITNIKVDNIGALYFLVTQYNQNESFNNVSSLFDFLFGRNSDNENNDNDLYEKSIEKLKFRIAETTGQYAHKLTDLGENQWIILLVNIGRFGGFKSRFVMKIQKKYVDQLENKKITFQDYLQHVEIYDEEI